jgi:hypothetical protein
MGGLNLTTTRISLKGTRWNGVCFRRFLLDTVPELGPSLNNTSLYCPSARF